MKTLTTKDPFLALSQNIATMLYELGLAKDFTSAQLVAFVRSPELGRRVLGVAKKMAQEASLSAEGGIPSGKSRDPDDYLSGRADPPPQKI